MESAKKKRLGSGRVAFLARIEVFREKINAGHTMTTVYEDNQEQLGISYSQFVNYVNRYIRKKPTNETKSDQAREASTPGSAEKGSGKKQKEPEDGQPGFKSSEKRDDLFKPKP